MWAPFAHDQAMEFHASEYRQGLMCIGLGAMILDIEMLSNF